MTTSLTYDAVGELVGVSDPLLNAWSYSYDSLGRRTAASDPDLGSWTYAYDDAGQLTAQTDAIGQQTLVTYDDVGRVLTRTSGYGLPIEATDTYTYDEDRTGFYNIGHLTTAANDNAIIASNYDDGGRPVSQTTTVDATDWTTTASYDAGGRLLSRTSPDTTSSGAFAYNAAGQQLSLAGSITSATYAADGQVKTVAYANGGTAAYGYSATRGWLNTISVVKGATPIESLTYTHDDAGRITAVAGGRADESWSYGYDGLDRLLTATNTNTPALSQSFTYDVAGNLASSSAVGSYAYPAQGASAYQPHAVQTAGSWTFGYDGNGNQTTRHTGVTLDREVTYDADNRPVTVAANGNTVGYLYGPDGARLKKVVGSDVTLYLGDDIERDPTGTFTDYVTPSVKRIAGVSSYLHRDLLASVRAITDSTGALIRGSAYEPYGQQVETTFNPLSPVESKGFIGERADAESGLTYLHARYYDALLGRFLQPDWWSPADASVGTNRYAYAGGDPIGSSDPGGHADHTVSSYFLEITGQTGQSYANSTGQSLHVAGGFYEDSYDVSPTAYELPDGSWIAAQTVRGNTTSSEAKASAAAIARIASRAVSLSPSAGYLTAFYATLSSNPNRYATSPQLHVACLEDVCLGEIALCAVFCTAAAAAAAYGIQQTYNAIVSAITPRTAPPANDGGGPPHGGPDHDAAIDEIIAAARAAGATNIRKNQVQVDANGDVVGNNRPDVQYDDVDGVHHNIEVDRNPDRSAAHGETITGNDPNSVCVSNVIGC